MSKMITSLVTTVLYDADKKIDQLKTAYYTHLTKDLDEAANLVFPKSRLLRSSSKGEVFDDLTSFGRLCCLQKVLRCWYEGAPAVMQYVPTITVYTLQRLDDATTQEQLEDRVYEVIANILEKCPNWKYINPLQEVETPETTEVDATGDADIPHTTDTGEDEATTPPTV